MLRSKYDDMESIEAVLKTRKNELTFHARVYKKMFAEKRVTYYFYSKGVPKRRTIYFYTRNFMHLCGISRYQGGWAIFYRDCLKGHLKPETAYALNKEFVSPKIDALNQLPKLLDREHVGFSDGAVVHKGTNYGELIRTKEDLVALGTIEDRTTKNQVPISLLNIEVSVDGMKKAIDDWSKVALIKVEPIEYTDKNMYRKDRERDKEMEAKMANVKAKVKEDNRKRHGKTKPKQQESSKTTKPRHYKPKNKNKKSGTTNQKSGTPNQKSGTTNQKIGKSSKNSQANNQSSKTNQSRGTTKKKRPVNKQKIGV